MDLDALVARSSPPSRLTLGGVRRLGGLVEQCAEIIAALDAWDDQPRQAELIPAVHQKSRTPLIVGAVVIVLLLVFWQI